MKVRKLDDEEAVVELRSIFAQLIGVKIEFVEARLTAVGGVDYLTYPERADGTGQMFMFSSTSQGPKNREVVQAATGLLMALKHDPAARDGAILHLAELLGPPVVEYAKSMTRTLVLE
jgi:hypothetical protein